MCTFNFLFEIFDVNIAFVTVICKVVNFWRVILYYLAKVISLSLYVVEYCNFTPDFSSYPMFWTKHFVSQIGDLKNQDSTECCPEYTI